MSTITKQWLQQKIAHMEAARDEIPFGLDEEDINTLAALRIALASLEAEAVGYVDAEYAELLKSGHIESCSLYAEQGEGCITVFTAQPAPVVPDEIRNRLKAEGLAELLKDASENAPLTTEQWETLTNNWFQTFAGLSGNADACRAAMLQGAEPDFREISNSSTKHFRENAEMSTKCWCRTCRPITFTDMRFVVCPDCGNKRCPHANDHRNACTESNEPGQEGSAYPAAPQQEVTQALAKGMERYGDAMQELAQREMK